MPRRRNWPGPRVSATSSKAERSQRTELAHGPRATDATYEANDGNAAEAFAASRLPRAAGCIASGPIQPFGADARGPARRRGVCDMVVGGGADAASGLDRARDPGRVDGVQ